MVSYDPATGLQGEAGAVQSTYAYPITDAAYQSFVQTPITEDPATLVASLGLGSQNNTRLEMGTVKFESTDSSLNDKVGLLDSNQYFLVQEAPTHHL